MYRTEGMRSTATLFPTMGKREERETGAAGKGCEVAASSGATAVGDGRVIWGNDESDGGDRGEIEMNQLICLGRLL